MSEESKKPNHDELIVTELRAYIVSVHFPRKGDCVFDEQDGCVKIVDSITTKSAYLWDYDYGQLNGPIPTNRLTRILPYFDLRTNLNSLN